MENNRLTKDRIQKRRKRKIQQAVIYYTAALVICALVLWGLIAGVRAFAGLFRREKTAETGAPVTKEQVIDRAELLAAGYDYDAAIESIKAFDKNYENNADLAAAVKRFEDGKSLLVKVEDVHSVTHVFFHTLIADTSKAFDGGYTQDGYNQYMTTISEFEKMLAEMYNRGYVLVNLHDVVREVQDDDGNTKFEAGEIWLPQGKKPMVMSQDDVSYYRYMDGDGFASRIIIGEDGYPTCEYKKDDGSVVCGDYDLVPILERFIREHPDFSYHGARATLAITGYDGVLGYRTCPSGEGYNPEDIEKAKNVAGRMRELGWVFASHSWGHKRYGEISADDVQTDAQRWEDEVKPILGDTDILIYAHGDDIAGIEEYSGAKFNILKSYGFKYFCNVDSHVSWVQIGADYVRQGRRNLDGYRMYYFPDKLSDLFDVQSVWDASRPTPVPEI